MDTTDDFLGRRPPTALRPLLGLTVLVVEDSRFACEAVRLLCLRSGARIRRADCLEHARRHLSVYRPSVVIIDIGLPDGNGAGLIRALARVTGPRPVILGTSGDPDMDHTVMDSGADGFLAKPIASLAVFQSAILRHLPADQQPPSPRIIYDEIINPDMLAFHDDLSHVAQVLDGEEGAATIDYVTQFLGGVARSASDDALTRAVGDLASRRKHGEPVRSSIAQLAALLQTRLNAASPI